MPAKRFKVALLIALAVVLPASGTAQEAFSPDDLTRLPTEAWLTNGGDLYIGATRR